MSDIKKVTVVDIDTGQSNKNVDDLTGNIKDLNNELKQSKSAVNDYNQSMQDLNEATQEAGSESMGMVEKFENVTKVTAGLVGGFEAVAAGMNLMGVESETMDKINEKMTSLMALVQGLQAMAEGAESFKKLSKGAKLFGKSAETAGKKGAKGMKALKKGIAATGIGLLIVAVGSLIANWEEFTQAIGLSEGAILKVKATFNGVMNVISSGMKHLSSAIGKLIRGDFEGAWDEFKSIVTKADDAFLAGQAETYKKDKDEKIANAQEAAAEVASTRADELDHQIKMNAIKEGEDYKYTQRGKKLMMDYFAERKKMYNKDSIEYKRVCEEEAQYLSDLQAHRDKINQQAKDEELKLGDAKIKQMELENAEGWRYTEEGQARILAQLEAKRNQYEEGTSDWVNANNAILEFQKSVDDYNKKRKDDEKQERENELKDKSDMANAELEIAKRNFEEMAGHEQLQFELTNEGYQATVDALNAKMATYEKDSAEYKLLADERSRLSKRMVRETGAMVDEEGNLLQEGVQNTKNAEQAKADAIQGGRDVFAATMQGISQILDAASEAEGVSAKKKKQMQIASATINTIMGALAAFNGITASSGGWAIALAAIQAAVVLTTGFIQIDKIRKIDPETGAGADGAGGDMAANPISPEAIMAAGESNMVKAAEIQDAQTEKNAKDSRVYVTESDIQGAGNRVKVAETESTF